MKKRIIMVITIICIFFIGVIEWKTQKKFTTDVTNVNEIVVVDTMDKVKVELSEDDKIHVFYYEGIGYHYNINEENKMLTIIGKNRIPIIIDIQSPSLIIRVPKDYDKNIKINTEKSYSFDEAIQ